MFTEKEWEKTRPDSAKASGIAKALKDWFKFCEGKDPSRFKAGKDFEEALEAALALGEAVDTAMGKLRNDKSDKGKATVELLKAADKELVKYAEKIGKVYSDNLSEFEGIIDGAAAALKTAQKLVTDGDKACADYDRLFKQIQTRLISQGAHESDAKDLTGMRQDCLDEAAKVEDGMERFRGDKNTECLRRRGAQGLVNDYKIKDADAKKVGDFVGIMREISELEKHSQKVIMEFKRVAAIASDLLDEIDASLDESGKGLKILQRARADLIKFSDQLARVQDKNPTNFANKYTTKTAIEEVKKNPIMYNTFASAPQTIDFKLGQTLQLQTAVTKRYSDALKKVPKRSDETAEVSSEREAIIGIGEGMVKSISEFTDKLTKGIAHARAIVEELDKAKLKPKS